MTDSSSVVQYRVGFAHADPDMIGCPWRSERPSDEELAAWREDFIGPVWVEQRTVTYGPVERSS
jgi:hypothetical protein